MEKKPTCSTKNVDGYIARNRDALNASIKKSRSEIAEGKTSTKSIDDIVADGRRHFSRFI